jgi:hypothetical protein
VGLNGAEHIESIVLNEKGGKNNSTDYFILLVLRQKLGGEAAQ